MCSQSLFGILWPKSKYVFNISTIYQQRYVIAAPKKRTFKQFSFKGVDLKDLLKCQLKNSPNYVVPESEDSPEV